MHQEFPLHNIHSTCLFLWLCPHQQNVKFDYEQVGFLEMRWNSRERDQIKFVDLRFERWQVVGLSELCWGKVMVAYKKAPQQRKKEGSERLRGERDQIKFIDLGFEIWQVVSLEIRWNPREHTCHMTLHCILESNSSTWLFHFCLHKVSCTKHQTQVNRIRRQLGVRTVHLQSACLSGFTPGFDRLSLRVRRVASSLRLQAQESRGNNNNNNIRVCIQE